MSRGAAENEAATIYPYAHWKVGVGISGGSDNIECQTVFGERDAWLFVIGLGGVVRTVVAKRV